MHDNKVLECFTCTAAALLLLLPAAGLCCGSPWGLLPRGLEICGRAVVLRMKASLTQNKLTGITLKKTPPDAQWDVQVRALLRPTTGQREKKQI